MSKLYEGWDEFWEEDKVSPLGKIMTKSRLKAYSKVIDELDGVETVIDVGCGSGIVLKLLTEKGLEVVGIDVSPNSIKTCKRKGLNARLGKLEEEEGKYDLVESEGMLEHFLNFEPYVKDMARISKKYIMAMQPNHHSFLGRLLVNAAQMLRGDDLMFEFNYRMKDFIQVFEKHGFKVIKNEPVCWNISRLLVFERVKP